MFPGLIYRMKDPKIVLLIFVSGKVVLTGETEGVGVGRGTLWAVGCGVGAGGRTAGA